MVTTQRRTKTAVSAQTSAEKKKGAIDKFLSKPPTALIATATESLSQWKIARYSMKLRWLTQLLTAYDCLFYHNESRTTGQLKLIGDRRGSGNIYVCTYGGGGGEGVWRMRRLKRLAFAMRTLVVWGDSPEREFLLLALLLLFVHLLFLVIHMWKVIIFAFGLKLLLHLRVKVGGLLLLGGGCGSCVNRFFVVPREDCAKEQVSFIEDSAFKIEVCDVGNLAEEV